MTPAASRFAVSIVANDQTKSGISNARSRFKQLGKDADRFSKGSGMGGAAAGFVDAGKAAERTFGAGSAISKIGGRMDAIREAGSAMSKGFTAATESSSGLGNAMGGLTVAAGGAVGVLIAAGAAGFSFVNNWAKSGATIGQLSATIGVASRDLQEFQAVAERNFLSKDAATTGIGGLAQTFNDAYAGRNNDALALMSRLGVRKQIGANGNLDYTAMTLDLAEGIKRQANPQTQAMIAGKFGASSLLPVLKNGRAAIAADMADAGRNAAVMSDGAIDSAKTFHRGVIVATQGAQRVAMNAAGYLGEGAAPGMAGVVNAERGIIAGVTRFAGAVEQGFAPAVVRFGSFVDRLEHLGEHSRQDQVSPKGARGVMQVMPDTAHEEAALMGIPFDEARYKGGEKAYSHLLGDHFAKRMLNTFSGDEVLGAAAYNAGPGAVSKWIKRFGDPRKGEISDQEFAAKIPFKETRDYVNRVVLEVHGLPTGTKVTAKSHGGVAVAHAMPTPGP